MPRSKQAAYRRFSQGTLAALAATVLGYLAYRGWNWLFWPAVAADFGFALVPGQVQTALITRLGADAKVMGLYVPMLIQVVAGGFIALIAGHARWLGHALGVGALIALVSFGLKFIAPVVQFPEPAAFLAGAVLGGIAFALAYKGLASLQPHQSASTDVDAPVLTRRNALAALGTVGGAVLLWPWVRGDLNRTPLANTPIAKPTSLDLVESVRSGTVAFDQIPHVSPWHTPEPQFYYISKNLSPHQITLAQWQHLGVGGLVETPLQLTLDELQQMAPVTAYNTLQCIDFDPYSPLTDDLIGNGLWTGVPLSRVLARAGVRPNAQDLVLEASDGYSDSLPVSMAMAHEDILLAWALNGKPLSAKHGYPLRLIVPGQYGMKNVKHVKALTAVSEDYKGYWQKRGWVDDAPTQTYAKIETLGFNQALPAQAPAIIAGWTFAGRRGISKVEVSTDNGKSWQDALLESQRAPNTWLRWAHIWQPQKAGRFGVKARAYDSTGTPQIERRVAAFPAGTTGHHRVWVDVVTPAPTDDSGSTIAVPG